MYALGISIISIPFYCYAYAGKYSCSCYQRLPTNSTCLAWEFSFLHLNCQVILRSSLYIDYIIFLTLKVLHYTKSTCWISFKLTAFNNDTISFLNINFLRDQLSFKVAINVIILIGWCHSCVLWSCENKNGLEFFQNTKFKWSND